MIGIKTEIPVDNLRYHLIEENDCELHLLKNDDNFVKLRYKFPYNLIRKVDNNSYEVYFNIGGFRKLKFVTKEHIENEYILNQLEKEVEESEFIEYILNNCN